MDRVQRSPNRDLVYTQTAGRHIDVVLYKLLRRVVPSATQLMSFSYLFRASEYKMSEEKFWSRYHKRCLTCHRQNSLTNCFIFEVGQLVCYSLQSLTSELIKEFYPNKTLLIHLKLTFVPSQPMKSDEMFMFKLGLFEYKLKSVIGFLKISYL